MPALEVGRSASDMNIPLRSKVADLDHNQFTTVIIQR
jgi:hypothetical protein